MPALCVPQPGSKYFHKVAQVLDVMWLSGFLSGSSQENYLAMAGTEASPTFFIQPHFINSGGFKNSEIMSENCPFHLTH